jgi:hypothetical protein
VVAPAGQRAITLASPAITSDRRRGQTSATLVQASVTAHLLGLRLLTLDAKVALVPADVTVVAPPAREPVAAPRASEISSGRARGRADGAGEHRGGLADAVRNLDEGARVLADVHRRRNGS